MATGFHRSAHGRFTARFDEVERGLLMNFMDQLIEFIAPDEELDPDADPLAAIVGLHPGSASAPDDPALARLFPTAYPDDEEAASDFRRFTERTLRENKMAHARSVKESLERSGEKVTLSAQEANAWMLALNDLRIALGTRLDIQEDDSRFDEVEDDDEHAATFHIYDWLTYLQETLVRSLSRSIENQSLENE